MGTLTRAVTTAVKSVRDHSDLEIDVAVILGSGLNDLVPEGYREVAVLDYADIDGLPESTAPSHQGKLSICSNGKRNIALCSGRHHLYEGYSAQEVSTLIYLVNQLGAEQLVITNAAGALNSDFQPGEVMLVSDHINFTGQNPLIGQDETFGIRFPDMSRAYCPEQAANVQDIARSSELTCHSGIYAGVTGPSLETSAERRMLRTLGADAVGMSTVLEVIAANHCGMRVTGLSAITNLALGDENQAADTVEEVLENAAIAGRTITQILNRLLA